MKPRASLALVVLGLITGAGCTSYRLGPTTAFPAKQHSLQVGLIQNKTLEPRLVDSINNALRKRFQQDGSYRLDTRGESDVILTGVITRFDRAGVSYQPADTLTPRDFSLGITMKVTVRERSSGKVIFDRDISGHTTIRSGPDLASAERQAIPLIAEELARNAASLIVDGNW